MYSRSTEWVWVSPCRSNVFEALGLRLRRVLQADTVVLGGAQDFTRCAVQKVQHDATTAEHQPPGCIAEVRGIRDCLGYSSFHGTPHSASIYAGAAFHTPLTLAPCETYV